MSSDIQPQADTDWLARGVGALLALQTTYAVMLQALVVHMDGDLYEQVWQQSWLPAILQNVDALDHALTGRVPAVTSTAARKGDLTDSYGARCIIYLSDGGYSRLVLDMNDSPQVGFDPGSGGGIVHATWDRWADIAKAAQAAEDEVS